MAKITGFGGLFFKSPDPAKLAAWYRDVLGLSVESWGGALLPTEGLPPHQVWTPFKADTTYFAPSTSSFMVNFAVDDMDGFLAGLTEKGVEVLGRNDEEFGRFAWILDPDGNKLELWEPKG